MVTNLLQINAEFIQSVEDLLNQRGELCAVY